MQRRPVDIAMDRRYYRDPEEFFRSGRVFVNCEGDEDFDYLLKHIGEDALMCSSDFPHGDPSDAERFSLEKRLLAIAICGFKIDIQIPVATTFP